MAVTLFRDTSGNVTGYGGYMYEQLKWISLHLNLRFNLKAVNLLFNRSIIYIRGRIQIALLDTN